MLLIKEALNPSAGLYVVLSVQPVFVLAALGFVVWVGLVKGFPSGNGDEPLLGKNREKKLVREHLLDELGTTSTKKKAGGTESK